MLIQGLFFIFYLSKSELQMACLEWIQFCGSFFADRESFLAKLLPKLYILIGICWEDIGATSEPVFSPNASASLSILNNFGGKDKVEIGGSSLFGGEGFNPEEVCGGKLVSKNEFGVVCWAFLHQI